MLDAEVFKNKGNDMKFRAHETFFIRKGWLSKGMKSIAGNPSIFMGIDADGNKINPMDVLGIGANMVKSLRYWLQAVGLSEERLVEGRKIQELTELGELIHVHDPYIEEVGTLCLLHYNLCTNKDFVSAWYYFFNEFSLRSFSKDDFKSSIESFLKANNEEVSERSLEDDFSCIINTYFSRERSGSHNASPENNIDCPLGELELIDYDDRKARTYKKKSVSSKALSPTIALALIHKKMEKHKEDSSEIPIGKLLAESESLGKVFNLDTIGLSSVLTDLEMAGHLKIIRTAGLDIVKLSDKMTYLDYVEKYYESIS